VVSHFHYSPYGVETVFGSEDGDSTFVARGDFGELMILGFRMYDPVVGRFLSPDPVLQRINQYSYTLGNPVWFSDPDGRASATLKLAVLGLVLAVIAGSAAAYTIGIIIGSLIVLKSILDQENQCNCEGPETIVIIIDHPIGSSDFMGLGFGGINLAL